MAPAIVIERLGVTWAAGRSSDLVKGWTPEVLGVVIVIQAGAFVPAGLFAATHGGSTVATLGTAVWGTRYAPFHAFVLTGLYYGLLEREHQTTANAVRAG